MGAGTGKNKRMRAAKISSFDVGDKVIFHGSKRGDRLRAGGEKFENYNGVICEITGIRPDKRLLKRGNLYGISIKTPKSLACFHATIDELRPIPEIPDPEIFVKETNTSDSESLEF